MGPGGSELRRNKRKEEATATRIGAAAGCGGAAPQRSFVGDPDVRQAPRPSRYRLRKRPRRASHPTPIVGSWVSPCPPRPTPTPPQSWPAPRRRHRQESEPSSAEDAVFQPWRPAPGLCAAPSPAPAGPPVEPAVPPTRAARQRPSPGLPTGSRPSPPAERQGGAGRPGGWRTEFSALHKGQGGLCLPGFLLTGPELGCGRTSGRRSRNGRKGEAPRHPSVQSCKVAPWK